MYVIKQIWIMFDKITSVESILETQSEMFIETKKINVSQIWLGNTELINVIRSKSQWNKLFTIIIRKFERNLSFFSLKDYNLF